MMPFKSILNTIYCSCILTHLRMFDFFFQSFFLECLFIMVIAIIKNPMLAYKINCISNRFAVQPTECYTQILPLV